MKDRVTKLFENRWIVLAVGILLGALVILAIRFATYAPEDQVHYHANFAVYINGQREEFKDPKYYQEVAVCSSTHDLNMPEQRTHMHDSVNSVIHVHDHVVTWGQFFENLGWYVGMDFIQTADGTRYVADSQNKVHIILNGQDYTELNSIANMVIKDRDRLLVSFGDAGQKALDQEFKSVPNTAKKYDETKDPASCSGSEKVTPGDRMKHLF